MPEYMILYSRFPAACEGNINGIASLFPDGRYIIMIDNTKDEETQAHALKHELAHLYLKHLERDEGEIEQIEAEADEYAARMTPEELEYLLTFCTGTKTIPEAKIAAFDLEYKPA